jgi:hypothetical protein
MTKPRWRIPSGPLLALRWSVSAALGVPAVVLVAGTIQGAGRNGSGLHRWLLMSLGLVEALGAILFLVPRLRRAGAWSLGAALIVASAFHLAEGQRPPFAFVVYLPAIAVAATASEDASGEE